MCEYSSYKYLLDIEKGNNHTYQCVNVASYLHPLYKLTQIAEVSCFGCQRTVNSNINNFGGTLLQTVHWQKARVVGLQAKSFVQKAAKISLQRVGETERDAWNQRIANPPLFRFGNNSVHPSYFIGWRDDRK